MLIVCPSCRHAIRVVDLRPGRFTPRCPRCDRVFQMTVPEEKGRSPVIVPLDPSVFAEPVMLEVEPEPPVEIPELVWPVSAGWKVRAELRPGPLPRGVPRFLGRHILLKLLGSGPRGQAFLGLPLGLDGVDVIKVQDPDRSAHRVFMSRFVREAFAASRLDHPNLAAIRDLGLDRGRAFAAVERVPGPSLGDLIKEKSPFEPFTAATLILQAARGLRAAHEQGLWHRDVKPENLLLDPAGLVKVVDLGLEMTPSLAEALAHKEKPRPSPVPPAPAAAGSPAYMAPEQAADPASSDGRADIYALGGTFYHLVTGRPPFAGESAVELIGQHREERLVPPREFVPRLPGPIADIIQTMLGKRLAERYPTMGAVVDVLEKVLDVRGEQAAAQLEQAGESIQTATDALNSSSAAQLRFRVVLLSAAIVLAFTGLLLYLRLWAVAAGIVGFATITALVVLIVSGLTHRSELLRLASRAVLGSGRRAWVIVISACAIAFLALWIWGGFLPWFLLLCTALVTAA
ncbi:MAG: protein kinase domain-containing protein, partial [Isosphaeraceae bacterium]